MLLAWEELDGCKTQFFGALVTILSLVSESIVEALGDIDVGLLPSVPCVAPYKDTQVGTTCGKAFMRLFHELILI